MRTWTPSDEAAYRDEVKDRFSTRTPPRHADEVDWEYRVTRSEMRSWAKDTLGALPPEHDERWAFKFKEWYRSMAKLVIRKSIS